MIWLRGIAVWFLIIIVESVHGTIREVLITPRLGDAAARRLGMVTGMALIFAIAYFTVRWIGTEVPGELIAIGVIWSALTILFEAILGLYVFGFSAERVVAEYDVRQGGMMGFGILFMTFAPVIAAWFDSGPRTRDK